VLGSWQLDGEMGSPQVAPDTPSQSTSGTPRVLVTATGLVTEILGGGPGGWRIRTPCNEGSTVANGEPMSEADVVIDPGHGGTETGPWAPTA
jgi:N-acetylmuramoyl-L-alanine amidase